MKEKRTLGAIVLAAGRGKRMNAKGMNKVTLFLADKPIILHAIELLEKTNLKHIVIVVGFAKQSVINIIKNPHVIFAEQRKRLGTGHAVRSGLEKIPPGVTDVLVIQGDDSFFYRESIISELVKKHLASDASVTFLTIHVNNPFGLGRIMRDSSGKVLAVVEEKDATDAERKINEINPACYIFKSDFLKKYLPKIKKSPVTGEFYLTRLIDIAIENKESIETMRAGFLPWRGVNTKEELEEAERLYREHNGRKQDYVK